MIDNQHILDKSAEAARYTVVLKTLSRGATVFATVVLIRALSESQYGIYNLLYSTISILAVAASLGLANTLQRYVPEYYRRGENLLALRLYHAISLLRFLTNSVILGLLFVFWDALAPHFKVVEYRSYFAVFIVVILLHLQWGLLETYLNAFFLHKYTNLATVLFSVAKVMGYGVCLLLGFELRAVVAVDVASYILLLSCLYWILSTKMDLSTGSRRRFSREEIRRMTRYAFYYNFNDAGTSILSTNFDNFFIAFFLNPIQVGAYAFANRINWMIFRLVPTNYLYEVIRPAFFSVGATLDPQRIRLLVQCLLKVGYIFHISVFFFFFCLSYEVVTVIFGGKFADYHYMLYCVYFFTMLSAFEMPFSLLAQLRERSDVILYSKFFAIYNLLADFVLIDRFGLLGAVAATGTAVLGKNLFIWNFVRSEASLGELVPFFMKISCAWMLFALVVKGFQSLGFGPRLVLAFGIAAYLITFVGQFRLKLFNAVESKVFRSMISNFPFQGQVVRILHL